MASSRFLEGKLYLETTGGGPGVLLLHSIALDHTYLRPWLDPLARVARLIFYDHRGHGRSAPLRDWRSELTLENILADADAVRAATGSDRVVLFGHSNTVGVALEYARRFPERTLGLLLCCGTARFDHGESILPAATRLGTPEQVADLAAIFTGDHLDDETFRRLCLSVLPLYFHRYDRTVGESFARHMVFRGGAFLQARNLILAGFDALPWLGSLHVPALVLSGRHDIIMPVEQTGERLAAALPQAVHRVFEASGHFPFIEEQEAFLAVVTEWLARLPGGG